MAVIRDKFSSQIDSALLAKARSVAQRDGKQFQSLLEEALAEYLERHQAERPRAHVMQALGLSMDEFDDLYKALAK